MQVTVNEDTADCTSTMPIIHKQRFDAVDFSRAGEMRHQAK